ncbi:hypothetical protein [Actinoplanes regularis]|uniref:ABC-2 family transporter protein n=1 Tax=Actinoplanes regularis TaxID=52697 RepID=A0A239K8U7_9ACTN|nr:hypothetical protein [Actinoplanes regularis]GIE92477.1 hypothetical protein Are01nite_89570 [Actinoplanes regularis]SNT14886.1 hypothetical protein SAMN06264365_1465 [Actinoplanes regularis]
MSTDLDQRPWLLRWAVLGLIVAGGIIQIVMSTYYLSVAHAPQPHDLPVGYLATPANAADVQARIEQGGQFAAHRYDSTDAMITAIRTKDVFGGLDVSATPPHLYVASAAGPAAAAALRTAFTTVVQQQTAGQVQQLVAAGQPVPAPTVQQLTTPPAITDVVALPPDDRSGASIGLLVQALAIGATVASIGLGRIGSRTKPSLLRGVGHTAALLAYAAASAAAVLVAAHAFGVVTAGADVHLFRTFLLVSVAVTGSVAGLVALIGPAGSFLGTAYFLFGVPISGATVLAEFLPPAARVLGQVLPTGAGATLVRDNLYFPDASVSQPVATLALYAIVGLLLVLVTNALANRSRRASLLQVTPRAEQADAPG